MGIFKEEGIKMKVLFLFTLAICSAQNMVQYEIFEPDFLKTFNPLKIYRDPFQFDDSSSDSSVESRDGTQNMDFLMQRYVDQMTGINDGPRDSISYAPAWFKL